MRAAKARGKPRNRAAGKGKSEPANQGLGFALRIGVDLVAALAVGVGIGLLIDEALETRPWFMVVFFFLGAGAGMLNVYRTVSGIGHGVGYKPAEKAPHKDEAVETAEEDEEPPEGNAEPGRRK
ncbi:MAG: AtpZ/AtpI family protein [Alphaproteobacteria bacterium]